MKKVRLFEPKRQVVIARPRERRGSRHDRGYDYEWTKKAGSYLRRHPICQECDRNGLNTIAELVDHKIPIRHRPDLRLDPKNWWALCNFCHQGLKRRMEAFSEKSGQVELLILWCDNPKERPAEIASTKARKPKQDMIV